MKRSHHINYLFLLLFLIPLFSFASATNSILDVPITNYLTGYTFSKTPYSLFGVRSQWPASGNYKIYTASYYHHKANIPQTIGANIEYQTQNIYNTIYALRLHYSYKLSIDDNLQVTPNVSVGFKANNINYGRLTFEDLATVSQQENETNIRPNFYLGSSVLYKKAHLFAVSINPNGLYSDNTSNEVLVGYTGQIKSYISPLLVISPQFLYNFYNSLHEFQYGVKTIYKPFVAGIYTRHNEKFNFNAAIILLGTCWENYELNYAYDINLTNEFTFFNGLGAHEVTFSVKFRYKRKSIMRKAIKCPTF